MKTKILIPAFLLILHLSVAQDYQAVLEGELTEQMPGIQFAIKSLNGGKCWSGAAGVVNIEDKVPLNQFHTFRIASVTKTFVAASILRLMEEGHLSLDDLLAKHISQAHADMLSQEYDLKKITIRQVLRHSAGFSDHTNAPEYFERIFSNPGHKWSRTEQVRFLVDFRDPMGNPGMQFHYSDTGYILLGEVIEKYTGKDLDGGIKDLLDLEGLGLVRTDFEGKDSVTDSLRIHQYFQGMDTYAYSPSIDYYGGGGLLSTTSELVGFFEALFTNRIFKNPETLPIMLEPVSYETPAYMDYQMGMYRVEINGMQAYNHTGFWGTQVLYIPDLGIFMAANYSAGWKGGAVAPVLSKMLEIAYP